MTLVEAYDGRTTEQRWDWVLSRVGVATVGKEEARRLLAEAVLAVIARQQKGQVTVFTSDVDDLERLLPETVTVKKV
ncbi:hypothetical protein [Streptomyces sp. GQFP]|uniref:hypothetical protein n=1 Tax=Streptomyces sp. GQFP TaxID=2907545 RepID=UPI001F359222|nr:hypothetical protein [Streptomyces sp. GQFP]UIX31756.1 hypothetical protein LUX31_17875 [Streptomyces sp. GQFP]